MMDITTKRKYPRFSKDCEVRFKVLDFEDMPLNEMSYSGETVNISGGGACFKSESRIADDSVLALEISVPDVRQSVVAIGRVVWVKENDDGSFENGVEFWWLGYRGEDDEPTAQYGATTTE